MRFILTAISVAAGVMAVTPIGGALAPRVVGAAVPTRIEDLLGYLSLSASPPQSSGLIGPLLPSPAQVGPLKELSALSLGGGIAVGALVYVVLGRVLP
jgi:hypothetical protein